MKTQVVELTKLEDFLKKINNNNRIINIIPHTYAKSLVRKITDVYKLESVFVIYQGL